MKIAQFTPLWERVPLPTAGRVELVIRLLIDQLFTRRDEVMSLAWDDSITATKLGSIPSQILQLAVKQLTFNGHLAVARQTNQTLWLKD